MRRPRLLVNLVSLVAMGFVSAPAFAQAPMRPLFGRTSGDTAQTLSAGFSIGHGLFQTRALAGDTDDEEGRRDTSLTFATASLAYTLSGGSAGLSAGVASTGRYYSEVTDSILDGHGGNVNAWWQISNRTRLSAGQAVSYGPAFQGGLGRLTDPTPGFRPDLDIDIDESRSRVLRLTTDVSVSHELSRRSSLSASYGRNRRKFVDEDVSQVWDTASVRYRHEIAQGLGARVGYGYRVNRVTGDEVGRDDRSRDHHVIDAGLDFSRSLSLNLDRRTTVSFGVGSAITQRNERTRAHLTGHATLTRSLRRTWSASVGYHRNVGFVDGLTDAVLTDRVSGNLGGQLSRRTSAAFHASAVRGDRGSGTTTFLSYNTGAQLSIALAQRVGLGGGYLYRYSEYDRDAFVVVPDLREANQLYARLSIVPVRLVTIGLSYSYALYERDQDELFGRFDRHAVVLTAGISAPLLARTRGTNASR